MGAYANPQEIEGQFDLTQESRNLQRTMESVVSSVTGAIDKRAEAQRANEKANKSIIDNDQAKAGKLRVIVADGVADDKVGLNYDCYDGAIEESIALEDKIRLGSGTLEDKQTVAQIHASVGNMKNTAGNLYQMTQSYQESKQKIGEGAIDLKGSSPVVIKALESLNARDGSAINFGFGKKGSEKNITDYSQEGLYVNDWTDANGFHKGDFISGKNLNIALDGNQPYGVVYKKSYASDIKKIKDTFKIGGGGIEIFEYKGDEPTGRVSDAYLTEGYGKTNILNTTATGQNRQAIRLVDMQKVLLSTGVQADSIAESSIANPNEVASKYSNYILPAMDSKNPNFDKYNELDEDAKFVPIPGWETAASYNDPILPDDTAKLDAIKKNNRAALAQTIKKEQSFGSTYFVSNFELNAEKKLMSEKKNLSSLEEKFAKREEKNKELISQGKTPIINKFNANQIKTTVNIPDAKGNLVPREFLITRSKDGKIEAEIIIDTQK